MRQFMTLSTLPIDSSERSSCHPITSPISIKCMISLSLPQNTLSAAMPRHAMSTSLLQHVMPTPSSQHVTSTSSPSPTVCIHRFITQRLCHRLLHEQHYLYLKDPGPLYSPAYLYCIVIVKDCSATPVLNSDSLLLIHD